MRRRSTSPVVGGPSTPATADSQRSARHRGFSGSSNGYPTPPDEPKRSPSVSKNPFRAPFTGAGRRAGRREQAYAPGPPPCPTRPPSTDVGERNDLAGNDSDQVRAMHGCLESGSRRSARRRYEIHRRNGGAPRHASTTATTQGQGPSKSLLKRRTRPKEPRRQFLRD